LNTNGKRQTINVGVIGYGYWGPNIVRNFHNASNAAVVSVCDLNPKSLERVRKSYPSVAVTTDPADILNNPAIDAVAIVTPVSHHFPLRRRLWKSTSLLRSHSRRTRRGQELIELAARKKLLIMVDHTFLFSGAVRKIRELIDNDTSARCTTTIRRASTRHLSA
jgi:predicted dehydrogenase